jgi:hypothetical protein
MADDRTQIELTLRPVLPETVDSAKREIQSFIESIMREEGLTKELQSGQAQVETPRTMPVGEVIHVVVEFLTPVASDIFVRKVLPKIEARFETWWQKRKSSKSRKNGSTKTRKKDSQK